MAPREKSKRFRLFNRKGRREEPSSNERNQNAVTYGNSAPDDKAQRGISDTSTAESSSVLPKQSVNPFGPPEMREIPGCNKGHIINDNDPPLIKKAKQFIQCLIEDPERLHSMCTPGYETHFVEVGGRSHLTEQIGLLKGLRASFPDLFFASGQYSLLPGRRVYMGIHQISGTHTGEPFSFGPFPKIPATGIRCVNDPETMILEFDSLDRVKAGYIQGSGGHLNGPPGLYMQIGGKLE